jgi:hypothetical protein
MTILSGLRLQTPAIHGRLENRPLALPRDDWRWTRVGRERSRAEFERLLHDAGFELRSVISPTVFMSILVAEPASQRLVAPGIAADAEPGLHALPPAAKAAASNV